MNVDGVQLAIGCTLQCEIEGDGQRRSGVDMRNSELLVDRIRGDDGAKEIVVVLPIQESGKVSDSLLENNGEGKTVRRCRSRTCSLLEGDTFARDVIPNQPINAFGREGCVDACAVKFDGFARG